MKKVLLIIALIFTGKVSAATWVEVDDASKLLWQMNSGGIVSFRNLNEFDSAQTGCCYAYYLDTTTPGGKTIWSTILAKIAAHKRITLGFPIIGTNANPQRLSYIGRHAHGTNE
jgi:hypothetical protein